MLETKVEWEACVGASGLQFSIFSRLGAVAGIKKFCCSGFITITQTLPASEMSFFAGGIKIVHTLSALIIAHRLIFGKQ